MELEWIIAMVHSVWSMVPWTHEPPLRYRNGQGLSVTRTCANDTSAIVDLPRSPQPSLASLAILASLASLASLATLTICFARLLAPTPVHAPERLARRLTSSMHTCLQHTPAARSLCSTPHQQLPHLRFARFARFACLLAQTPVGSARARALRSPSDEQHAHLLATHACSTHTCSLPHQQLPHHARLLHRSLRSPT